MVSSQSCGFVISLHHNKLIKQAASTFLRKGICNIQLFYV